MHITTCSVQDCFVIASAVSESVYMLYDRAHGLLVVPGMH